jgi:E3 ubiquitin-protein ligase HUWE1
VPEKWLEKKNDEAIVDPKPLTPEEEQATSSKAKNAGFFWHLTKETVSDVAGITRGVLKLLCNKRISETASTKTAIYGVIDQISQIMIGDITYIKNDMSGQHVKAQGLLNVHSLLTDERTSTTLQTIQLVSFEKAGGLDIILNIFETSLEEYKKVTEDLVYPDRDEKLQSLKYILEVIVDICQTITNQKYLHESPHTANWQGRQRDKSKAGYYEPHKHLIELRRLCLTHLVRLWNFDLLSTFPKRLIVNLVSTLIQILKADGEKASESALSSSSNPLSYMPNLAASLFGRPFPPPTAPIVPDSTRVDSLVDMGFSRGAAELALTRCNNNLSLAADYLLTHPAAAFATTTSRPATATVPPTAPVAAPVDENAPSSSGTNDVVMADAEPAAIPDAAVEQTSSSKEKPETSEDSDDSEPEKEVDTGPDYLDMLNKLREEIKSQITVRAVSLLDTLDASLVFSIKDLVCLVGNDNINSSLHSITEGILELIKQLVEKKDVESKALSIRLRLAILFINDNSLNKDTPEMIKDLVSALSSLLEFIRTLGSHFEWLSSVFLILESHYSRLDQPTEALVTYNGETLVQAETPRDYIISRELTVKVMHF